MGDALVAPQHETHTAPPAVQSRTESESAGGIDSPNSTEPKPLAGPVEEEKKDWLPRSWGQPKIAIVIALSLSGTIFLALVIALPVALTHRRNHDQSVAYEPKYHHNHPSYQSKANRPLFALHNFPDPSLRQHNGTWYAFATNPKKKSPNTIHLPVATSTDFVNWTLHKGYDALPTMGDWERKENHWAPDMIQRHDGKFVVYYSGLVKHYGKHHCIGAAVSQDSDPLGPYIPQNEPFACPHKYGGAIDPSPFQDTDGTMYVTYKADGNTVGHGGDCNNGKDPLVPTPIFLQQVQKDGVTKVGDPVTILDREQSDGPLVEAPNIIRSADGTYFLFFSSHCFSTLGYNVKYAHSKSIKGPYQRADRALLQTGDFDLKAPGGATVAPDGTKMVFHANCGGARCMYVSGIDIRSNHTIIVSTLDLPSNSAGDS
ncbi:Glycoside hydrolase family 43 [Penicillium alfredii]|uniref:Glycoside hydrolase family 43 n=1 Tax=Penicillium alfredii TaxID=1506179 RepID=A0A9W9FRE0_9EURO|nr:Glycoside hydrolase family 43 [Penicillium alfredii]KAJ5104914.1 Glycoside hydrolase family 43 [Penicillium alfredii]